MITSINKTCSLSQGCSVLISSRSHAVLSLNHSPERNRRLLHLTVEVFTAHAGQCEQQAQNLKGFARTDRGETRVFEIII